MSIAGIQSVASSSAIQPAQTIPASMAQSAYQQMADAIQKSPAASGGHGHHGHHHAGGSAVTPDSSAAAGPAPVTPSALKIVA